MAFVKLWMQNLMERNGKSVKLNNFNKINSLVKTNFELHIMKTNRWINGMEIPKWM